MREDILRILRNICKRKVRSYGQSVDFDETLTFCKIREEKGEKDENFDIKIMIFREKLDLL